MDEKTPPAEEQTTIDGLLNRRVMLEQPAEGYRVAVDTVLLAAGVPARASERVLDLGCGVGGAMLCLAARVPGVSVLGMDIRHELVLLCRDNVVRNRLRADLCVQRGDARKLSHALVGFFDHVMINPPYHDEARHDASKHVQKKIANTEKDGDLPLWIAAAERVLRSGGCLTLIHRADRIEEIRGHMVSHFSAIDICFIVPKSGLPPKRVIIRAWKKAGKIRQLPDFVLHQQDGRYTSEADAILRDGVPLG